MNECLSEITPSAEERLALQIAEEQRLIAVVQSSPEDAALDPRAAEAFGELYKMHAGGIKGWLAYRCQDPNRAEDLTQDTFIKAFTNIRQLDDTSRGIRPWLNVIARNTLFDSRRSESLRDHDSLDDGSVEPTPTARPIVETVAAKVDLSRYITKVLGDMDPVLAEAVVAVYQEDMTYTEAAEVLGVGVGTVSSRVARGRKCFTDPSGRNATAQPAGYEHTRHKRAAARAR